MASTRAPIALVNCEVFTCQAFTCEALTPETRIPQAVVLIDGGVIRAVGSGPDVPLPTHTRLIDAEGGRITPGLIDLVRMVPADDEPAASGVTSYLHTLAVVGEAGLLDVSEAAARLRQTVGARPLGLHLLGPWLPGFGRPPHWRDLWAAADGTIAMITLSPRLAGETIMQELAAAGTKIISVDQDEGRASAFIAARRSRHPDSAAPDRPLILTLQDNPNSLARLWQRADHAHIILAGSITQPLGVAALTAWSAMTGADFAAALRSATCAPADLLGLRQGRIAPGAPADLLCWTRFGGLAWTMVHGRVLFPAPAPAPLRPRPQPRQQHEDGYIYSMAEAKLASRSAAAEITAFLETQPGHVQVVNVEEDPEYQAADIDLLWRYGVDGDTITEISIEIKGDTWANTPNFFFETVSNKGKDTPGCFLHTQADWYFYYFIATRTLYCLPTAATRAWFLSRLEDFREVETSTKVGHGSYKTVGRLVPIAQVMAAVPRARRVVL